MALAKHDELRALGAASLAVLPEHLQHALGDREAAHYVDARQEDGRQGASHAGREERAVELQHAAHDDDAADGVGDADQRRVQSRSDPGHREVADEERQDEVPDVRELRFWDVRSEAEAEDDGRAEPQAEFVLVVLHPLDELVDLRRQGRHRRRQGCLRRGGCRGWLRRLGRARPALGWRRGMLLIPHHLPLVDDRGRPDDRVIPVRATEVGSTPQRLEQRGEIVRQHIARLRRHLCRVVRFADDRDPVLGDEGLVLLSQLTVAAGLRGEVHDHRAAPHGLQDLVRYQHRGLGVRDHRRRDDYVHVLNDTGVGGDLCRVEIRAHFPGVAAHPLARNTLRIDGYELGTQALDLVPYREAHVVRDDLRTEGMRGDDGAEAGDTRPDHEHARGGDGTAGSDGGPAEARAVVEGVQRRPVPGDVGHGGQRVQLLRARDARDEREVDDRRPGLLEHLGEVLSAEHVPEGDHRLRVPEHLHLVREGLVHLQDDVGLLQNVDCGVRQLHAPALHVVLVEEARCGPRARLDQDGEPHPAERRDRGGRDAHALLAGPALADHPDDLASIRELLRCHGTSASSAAPFACQGTCPGAQDAVLAFLEQVEHDVDSAPRVPEQHLHVLVNKERVVDTAVASGHAALQDDAIPGLPDLDGGHAVDGAARVRLRGWIDDVVGPDDDSDVVLP
mmetsp:Transcript_32158/g.90484  ORF Transcript_32158/g.90484 Transcript_32158/m.90484 type:complete len:677 (+) Transcript_32158:76-2106(+)